MDIRFAAVSMDKGGPDACESRFPVLLFFGSGLSLFANRRVCSLDEEESWLCGPKCHGQHRSAANRMVHESWKMGISSHGKALESILSA